MTCIDLVNPFCGALTEARVDPGSNRIIFFAGKANPTLTLLFSITCPESIKKSTTLCPGSFDQCDLVHIHGLYSPMAKTPCFSEKDQPLG